MLEENDMKNKKSERKKEEREKERMSECEGK